MSAEKNNKGILLEVGTNEVEFLLFKLGTQHYGINVGKVCQITMYDKSKVFPMPQSQPELLGVMTFRDKTISVVDLKAYLGSSTADANPRPLLLVTEFNQRKIGFVIDGVERIERCSWKQFMPVADTIAGNSSKSVVGTVTLGDTIVLILDLETIMSSIDPAMGVESCQDRISQTQKIDRSDVSILYCEDSIAVQKTLLKTLEKAGFKKFFAYPTGADGLEFLNATPHPHIDIILSDIEMPKMDGLTFCKNVRAKSEYAQTPFIFFSSMINGEMERKCQSVGGDAYFSKPQIHLIVDAIEDLLRARAQE